MVRINDRISKISDQGIWETRMKGGECMRWWSGSVLRGRV